MLNSSKARLPKASIGRLAAIWLAIALSSCGRGSDRAANDTSDAPDSLRVDTTVAPPVFREWTVSAGRYLLIANESPDSAQIVFPEFTADSSLSNTDFAVGSAALLEYDLIGADGNVTVGRLSSLTRSRAGCETWPRAVIQFSGEVRGWTIGLQAGRARGIAYTSLDRLTGRDSADFVVNLTRLASVAPNDTNAGVRGLSYVVRSAYVATIADSVTLVFAELVRRVNIEANPHEERTTIIAEKEAAAAAYSLAYSDRHTGDEESVPTTELLALVQLSGGTYAAFAARDFSDSGTYLMFVRSERARWRVRWSSAYSGC